MTALYTILLLIASNVMMIIAWYGHLFLKQKGVITDATPLVLIIVGSWLVAFLEYSLQVPANRLGFDGNGGPFNLMQLKVIQEVITLVVFVAFSMIAFHMQLKWNHIAAGVCLILAVYFVFK